MVAKSGLVVKYIYLIYTLMLMPNGFLSFFSNAPLPFHDCVIYQKPNCKYLWQMTEDQSLIARCRLSATRMPEQYGRLKLQCRATLTPFGLLPLFFLQLPF